jgi:ABC-type dipeptide/oligopeptide/nickel transport system permease subunit
VVGRHKRKLPPWLVGLMIAIVVFVLALTAMNILGFGDDPVVGSLG